MGRKVQEQEAAPIGFDRPLPECIAEEKLLLGLALHDDVTLAHLIANGIEPEDFGDERHVRVFRAAKEMTTLGREVNIYTLAVYWQESGYLEKQGVGILEYLSSLEAVLVRSAVGKYCEIVQNAAQRRRGIRNAKVLLDQLYENFDPTVAAMTAEKISNIFDEQRARKMRARTFAEIIEAAGGDESIIAPEPGLGLPMPAQYSAISGTLCHLRPGKYILLAARPGVGKSALVHETLLYLAELGFRGLLVTLEMGGEDVLVRELLARAEVGAYRYRDGKCGALEQERLRQQLEAFKNLGNRLLVVDDAEVTITGLIAEMRRLVAAGLAPDILVVDYLQLLEPEEGENRVQEVTTISRGLRRITKLFKIPVLAICNLSRGERVKDTDEPTLRQLRESGQLEFDADQIMFLWPQADLSQSDCDTAQLNRPVRMVNWRVAKNKDGITNHGVLQFDSEHCRFILPEAQVMPHAFHGQNGKSKVIPLNEQKSGERERQGLDPWN